MNSINGGTTCRLRRGRNKQIGRGRYFQSDDEPAAATILEELEGWARHNEKEGEATDAGRSDWVALPDTKGQTLEGWIVETCLDHVVKENRACGYDGVSITSRCSPTKPARQW